MYRRFQLLAATALVSVALTGVAQAQSGATTIEELVVTAEKREQSLQDVPVAVSAFTSEKRDLIGISTVQDITNFTPGLAYSAGNDRISLRGIGRLTNNLASEPGVATYVDGVYTSSTVEVGRSPLFIGRVEVLRGPQGTLYGRNSIGGAINAISKRPTDAFSGEIRGSYGNYNRRVLEGTVSGPITDGLRVRLGASMTKQDEGWFHNISGGPDEGDIRDEKYFEAQFEGELGDHADFWLKVARSKYDNRSAPGGRTGGGLTPLDTALITPGSLSPGAGYGFAFGQNLVTLGPARNGAFVTTGDLTAFSTNGETFNRLTDYNDQIAANVTYHLDGMDLKYVGGFQHYRYALQSDFDGTAIKSYTIPLNPGLTSPSACNPTYVALGICRPLVARPNVVSLYQENKEWFSHELNLASTNDGPLQWIVGAYLYNEKYKQPFEITLPDQAELATPSAAAANPRRIIYYTDQAMEAWSQAAFGQIDWRFTETLKLTAGLRYTADKKKGVESGRLFCFGCSAAVDPRVLGSFTPVLDITTSTFSGARPAGVTDPQKGVVGPAVTDAATGVRRRGLHDTWSAWTGTLGLEWQPDTNTLAYAKYSRGYKAGGFNSGTITAFPETDSEHVNAYELGLKKDWSGALQTNVSAFYYDYQDAQVPVSTQPPVGPSTSIFYNIPKARSLGFELESIWQPIANLQLLFNYSYLDATIRESCCITDGADPAAVAPGAKPVSALGAVDPITGAPTSRGQDLSGNHLPVAPRNKISFNANYTWEFEPGSITGSVSYVWRDKVYSSIFDRPYYQAPARSQIDARLAWKDAADRYTVILYGKNLTDEQDFDTLTATRQTGFNAGGAYNLNRTYVLVPPRTYGVELQYRW
ncbi:TonB-dependent receptor [Phenylobacterium sp.]|uniref:TonB-dependent receptor n=1 Tax=Phenylobacterium sp. TaxID=1871053 RepID=UPI00271682CA|nr:TonB-dependent receptor [Phenylobacterium sp.]MDO8377819.1 TonB-dependent receptor [Phenylobacterium sp.]